MTFIGSIQDLPRALELATRPDLDSGELVISAPDGQGDGILAMHEASPAELLTFLEQWSPG